MSLLGVLGGRRIRGMGKQDVSCSTSATKFDPAALRLRGLFGRPTAIIDVVFRLSGKARRPCGPAALVWRALPGGGCDGRTALDRRRLLSDHEIGRSALMSAHVRS